MCSPLLSRLLLCTALLLGGIADAIAGTRTASVSVSATVLASCRVEAASQVASVQAASARGYCSGSTQPATKAVLVSAAPAPMVQPVSQGYSQAGTDGASWVRLDVLY